MSLLKKLFGGGKASDTKAWSSAQAIQHLRDTEELLLKKQDHLEAKVLAEIETAKKNATTNKRLALAALKRKKRFEGQLTQIDGTLTTLEVQREALEESKLSVTVFEVMKIAGESLKKIHDDMDVDDIHKVVDDIQEEQDRSRELWEAMSRGIGADFDDDELELELNKLGERQLNDALNVAVTPEQLELPSIPSDKPTPAAAAAAAAGGARVSKKSTKREEDDLADLAEWASLTPA